jgi:hypothetical protein
LTAPHPHPLTSWAPLVGRWRLALPDQQLSYLGTKEPGGHPYGVCVSEPRLSEVELTVTVTIGNRSADSSGRVLLGYRNLNERYISAGIGGYGAAYNVTEYLPSIGWRSLALAGLAENLEPGRPYRITVRVAGQRLSLTVDQVRVLEVQLDSPLPDGQVGLFAWGTAEVIFKTPSFVARPARVFVVMQFSEPYQDLYNDVIRPVAAEFGLDAYHVGDVFGPGVILNDIAQGIVDARIVLAEVTPANPNVFYELGYAHALGKPTILLAERGRQLPFDVSAYRCLFYENTIAGKKHVEDALRKHLSAITST